MVSENILPRPTTELLSNAARLTARQREVLELLRKYPQGAHVDELGEALDMHVNTTRGHLDELVREGLVLARPSLGGERGRPRQRYFARAPLQDCVNLEYATLVEVLTNALPDLDAERARELGKAWARHTTAREATAENGAIDVLNALRDMGFDPSLREGGDDVGINACPFITAEGGRPHPAVCALHEGYLQEIIPSRKVVLIPFDRPGQCGVRIENDPTTC